MTSNDPTKGIIMTKDLHETLAERSARRAEAKRRNRSIAKKTAYAATLVVATYVGAFRGAKDALHTCRIELLYKLPHADDDKTDNAA